MIDTLVGAKVKLKVPCLGNDVGAVGYVYEMYQDFDCPQLFGVSVIFENGNYDGFSVKEQLLFLDVVDYIYRYSFYEFSNIMKLQQDFNNKFWNFDEDRIQDFTQEEYLDM